MSENLGEQSVTLDMPDRKQLYFYFSNLSKFGPQPGPWLGPPSSFNYSTDRPHSFGIIATPPSHTINK